VKHSTLDPRRRAFADCIGRMLADQLWAEITRGNRAAELKGGKGTASDRDALGAWRPARERRYQGGLVHSVTGSAKSEAG